MTYVEQARRILQEDRFATIRLGAVIEEGEPGYGKVSVKLTPEHRNAIGNPMGGAVFTLADFAYAVAVCSLEHPVVSLSSQITFLGAAKGEMLYAVCHQVKQGKSTGYYQIEVTDELGTHVASVTMLGFVLNR